jgi:hypothetical protein
MTEGIIAGVVIVVLVLVIVMLLLLNTPDVKGRPGFPADERHRREKRDGKAE